MTTLTPSAKLARARRQYRLHQAEAAAVRAQLQEELAAPVERHLCVVLEPGTCRYLGTAELVRRVAP